MDPETELAEILTHDRFVKGVARRLLGDSHGSDDVAQETWIVAMVKGRPVGAPLRAWLGTVARRLSLDRLRSARRRTHHEASRPSAEAPEGMSEIYAREEARRQLIDAIAKLAAPHREVLLLRFYEGMPPREIAVKLDIPLETVKSRLQRALAELRGRLQATGGVGGRNWSHWLPILGGVPWLDGIPIPAVSRGGAERAAEALVMSTKVKATLAVLVATGLTFLVWKLAGSGGGSDAGTEERSLTAAASPPARPEIPSRSEAGAPASIPRTAAGPVADVNLEPVDVRPRGLETVTVRVRVVSRSSKAPLPGVGVGLRMVAVAREPDRFRAGTTGADGVAILTDIPVGSAIFAVDRGGPMMVSDVRAGASEPMEIALDDGLDVPIRVVDGAGEPVRGAQIWIRPTHAGLTERTRSGTTGDGGTFLLTHLVQDVEVFATAEGFGPSAVKVATGLVQRGEAASSMELVLGGVEGRIEGTVKTHDGRAVIGCVVCVGPEPPSGASGVDKGSPLVWTRSDTYGRYRLAGLSGSRVKVEARAPGYGLATAAAEVVSGKTSTLDIRLPRSAAIAGRATDALGAGVEGLHVSAQPGGPVSRVSASTSTDGNFELRDLGPGRVDVKGMTNDGRQVSASLEVHEGATTAWNPILTAALEIRGRVLDESGAPLSDWRVQATPAAQFGTVIMGGGGPRTDSAGRFRVKNLAAGEYVVEVFEKSAKGSEDRLTIDAPAAIAHQVKPGGDELVIRVGAATRANAWAVGAVVNLDGNPLEGPIVEFEMVGRRATHQHPCDAKTGRFRVGPLSSAYRYILTASAPGYAPRAMELSGLTPNGTLDLGTIKLDAGGRIVIDASPAAMEILRSARLTAVPEAPLGSLTEGAALRETEGVFAAKGVPPGRWVVQIQAAGWVMTRAVVDVPPGGVARVAFEPARGIARTLEVRRQGGAPAPPIALTVKSADGKVVWHDVFHGSHDTTASVIYCLPAGDYRVRARDASGAEAESPLAMREGEGPVKIELP